MKQADTLRRAGDKDVKTVAELALLLWPEHTQAELEEEMAGVIAGPDSCVFLAELDGRAAGFAQCSLRRDYVEGASSPGPVGYLEGIFVKKPFRGRGMASTLLSACQQWAKQKGCREFASDCELDNRDSLAFHLSTGFEEKGRIICFLKCLK